jgi:iron-sulfur cluster insertion protein
MTMATTTAHITPRAVERLKGLGEAPILRLYISGQRCCGPRYGLALDKEIPDGFAVSDFDGVRLVLDADTEQQSDGAVIDYVETPEGSGFTVTTPGSGCSCGHG